MPVTPAGRLGASQSDPAKGLMRSRGWVVPSLVLVSQLFCPMFLRVMSAGRTWLTVMVMVVLARGHDWDTYWAPQSAPPPAKLASEAASPLYSSRSTVAGMPER